MRWITIPENCKFVVNKQEQEASFQMVLFDTWTLDQKFGANIQALEAALQIRNAFKDKRPGDVVPIDDAHWAILKAAVESPAAGYNPAFAIHTLPLAYAVLEARTTEKLQ